MKERVTFGDIAKHTGFSKTTISRYFNHPETVTPQNRSVIKQALEDLDYQENKVAQMLAFGKSQLLGFILPDLQQDFYSRMLEQLLDTYEAYGYQFIVSLSHHNPTRERQCIKELLTYQVDGLITISHALSSEELAATSVPVVGIERESRVISCVNTNSFTGAKLAVQQLAADGCQLLVHLSSSDGFAQPGFQRTMGFRRTSEQHKLSHRILLCPTEQSYPHMVARMEEIVATLLTSYPNQKIGFFCSDDFLANALLHVLYQQGIAIPEKAEIIGFDNASGSAQSIIPLSTISPDIPHMAQQTMETLARKLQGESVPIAQEVDPILISRQTTLG